MSERIVVRRGAQKGGRAASYFRKIVVKEEGGPEYMKNVEVPEILSHAKLCMECQVSGAGMTPALQGASSTNTMGEGLLALLAIAPPNRCNSLATMAVHSGHFPPLRWEVCASRKAEKPYSLCVVPASECHGSWLHSDWVYPSNLELDRTQLVVPLFAKIGAIYVYACEEKAIMSSEGLMSLIAGGTSGTMMMAGGGTAGSGGTLSTTKRSNRWKFSGVGYGACVASCCVMLMPSNAVDSLVTFGSPATFSHPEGILPFPHTHIQHCHDVVPHLNNGKLLAANIARMEGLGFLFPRPPYERLNTFRGKRSTCYDHPTNHIYILYPAAGTYSLAQKDLKFFVDGAGNLVMPSATNAPKNHEREATPLLELEGKTSPYDVRTMHPYVMLRDYLISVRLVAGRKVEIPLKTKLCPGWELLCKFVNPVGELLNIKAASELLVLQRNANDQQNNPASPSRKKVVSLGGAELERRVSGGSDDLIVKELAPGENPIPSVAMANVKKNRTRLKTSSGTLSLIELALLRAPKLVFTLNEQRVNSDSTAQLPGPEDPFLGLSVVTMLQQAGDTPENLMSFFKQFSSVACWDPRSTAKQLIEWGGDPPLTSSVAVRFVLENRMIFSCSTPPRKAPLPRHLSTRQAHDSLNQKLLDILSSPDGYHLAWPVAICSTVHSVGKSTMIQTLQSDKLGTSYRAGVGAASPTKQQHNDESSPTFAKKSNGGGMSDDEEQSSPSPLKRTKSRFERMREAGPSIMDEFADPFIHVKWAPIIGEKHLQVQQETLYGRRKTAIIGAPGNPESLLIRMNLNECFYSSKNRASRSTVSVSAMSMWVVTDEYTFDHLRKSVNFSARYRGGDIPGGTIAGIIFNNKGGKKAIPNPRLESAVLEFASENNLACALINAQDVTSCGYLQRLLIQWMVPTLNLPIDPTLLPPNVDLGSLVLQCEDTVLDYLKRTCGRGMLVGGPAEEGAADLNEESLLEGMVPMDASTIDSKLAHEISILGPQLVPPEGKSNNDQPQQQEIEGDGGGPDPSTMLPPPQGEDVTSPSSKSLRKAKKSGQPEADGSPTEEDLPEGDQSASFSSPPKRKNTLSKKDLERSTSTLAASTRSSKSSKHTEPKTKQPTGDESSPPPLAPLASDSPPVELESVQENDPPKGNPKKNLMKKSASPSLKVANNKKEDSTGSGSSSKPKSTRARLLSNSRAEDTNGVSVVGEEKPEPPRSPSPAAESAARQPEKKVGPKGTTKNSLPPIKSPEPKSKNNSVGKKTTKT